MNKKIFINVPTNNFNYFLNINNIKVYKEIDIIENDYVAVYVNDNIFVHYQTMEIFNNCLIRDDVKILDFKLLERKRKIKKLNYKL